MASYSSPSSLNMSWNELHGHAKIVIVGDTGIGKTSMLKRFVNRCFDDKGTIVTIGGAFYLTKEMKVNVKRGEIVDGTLRLQICDTGGREQFKTLDRSFYQEVKLVIVAFAFGDDESAENSKMWIHEVLNCTQDIPVFLVANKSDLADEAMRKKTSNRIRDMSENEEGAAHFFEVSAKSDPKSIDHLFQSAADEIADLFPEKVILPPGTPGTGEPQAVGTSDSVSCCTVQ